MPENDSQTDIAKTVPVRLKVASDLSCLATVCAFVEGACRALSPRLKPQERYDLQLAVNEACSNIIRHAYHNEAGHDLWVTADCADGFLIFTTIDQGETSKVSLTQRRLDARRSEELLDHGYGVILIQEVMDELEYFQDPKRGNVLVMKKRIPEKEA